MRAGVLAMVLATLGCGTSAPTAVPIEVPAGQGFDLSIGHSAMLTGPIATITLLDVPEDSRCPVGSLVLCVWAGNGRIRLEVQQSGLTDTLDLNTTLDPKQVDVGTLRILLTALNPPTVAGATIPKSKYVARLVASGRVD
jgi:hypothetical protein